MTTALYAITIYTHTKYDYTRYNELYRYEDGEKAKDKEVF